MTQQEFTICNHGKTYSGIIRIDDESVRIQLRHNHVLVPTASLTIEKLPIPCPRVCVYDEYGDVLTINRIPGIRTL